MAEIQIIRAECAVVVVKETDFDALLAQAGESEQLRANLSLAEEGLANYAQEIARLRNDLTACQLERDSLRRLIAENNEGCDTACAGRGAGRLNDCQPYAERGRQCPDCPRFWRIQLPAVPQPAEQHK